MAQTIPDITITTTWQSLNTLSGIAVGTAMQISNKSTAAMDIAEGAQPLTDAKDGTPLEPLGMPKSVKDITVGSLEIWIRIDADSSTGRIAVQEI